MSVKADRISKTAPKPHLFKESPDSDYRKVYKNNSIIVGRNKKNADVYRKTSRPDTACVVGIALGDEGKGRIVDNLIESYLKKKHIKKVYVIRFQGGNNAGHSVEKNGIKLALHVVPSMVFYNKAFGIMDRGMVIHPEDLKTEVEYVEKHTISLKNRLFLSDEAIMCTDLERAEEQLNKIKEGKSKGGTGRGIGPSYAHHYDKTGLRIYDLLDANWQKKLELRYENYDKEFKVYGLKLSEVEVPDFFTTKKNNKSAVRTVGDIKTFISRLKSTRKWFINRNNIVNSYLIHQKIKNDKSIAIVFEGAQAAGLDSWNGTRTDVTASNTTVYGLREGTGFWQISDIRERIGIIKIPYTSSVGARRMPTHIDLPKNLDDLPKNADDDLRWAAFIRTEAHEYGTTTGRPRDINFLDLEFLAYNARMSGIESIAVTHADLARDEQLIKICVAYKNKLGEKTSYQPGLRHSEGIAPIYLSLPGWDGRICRKAKNVKALPFNCRKFLAFLQLKLGYPIIACSTGPDRKNLVLINER